LAQYLVNLLHGLLMIFTEACVLITLKICVLDGIAL